MSRYLQLSLAIAAYAFLSYLVRKRQRSLGLAPSAELRHAIRVGIIWVNAPVLPLMFAPVLLYKGFAPSGSNVVAAALFLIGFIVAWAWWSINVSRWRRWAAGRGLDAEALQFEGESSSLLWPKGHFFERTEFDRLLRKHGA